MASGAQHYQMAEQTLAAIEARRAELHGQTMTEIAIASTSLDFSSALATTYRPGDIAMVKGSYHHPEGAVAVYVYAPDAEASPRWMWLGDMWTTTPSEVGPVLGNVADNARLGPRDSDTGWDVLVSEVASVNTALFAAGVEPEDGLSMGDQVSAIVAERDAGRARLAEVRLIHHEWGETDADDINQQRLWERIGYALTREEAGS